MLDKQILVGEESGYNATAQAPPLRAPNKLRVLHVGKFYTPHPGGMETHLQVLCGELKQSVEVEIVVANNERKTIEEVIDGIKVTRLGMSFSFAAAPVCPQLTRRIREAQADLVHIHWPNPTAVLAYLASGHRGRLIFSYHSDVVRQKILGKAFWPVLRHALKRADAIIVASPDYLETSPVLQKFRERCRVIPYGISPEQFDRPSAIEVAKIRKQYGPRIVLGVGRLVYYKGFEYLIRAMKTVAGHLLIIGNGPLKDELKREVRACGVSERVTILPDVRDVCPYYHAADVFALSSVARSEAFGIVQLEAMACGTPVVNTRLDSGVNFVSPGGLTGLTVPPANAEALSQAINALLDDPTLRAQYGRAGRSRVEQEFDLEVMANRTHQLYKEVMERIPQ
jgi:glycosyltransferase involved in cell wall biosynthesis